MNEINDAKHQPKPEHHLALVNQELARVTRRLPLTSTDRDDLHGYAMVGLTEACHRYNPAHGVPFSAFGRRRIRGAIIDGIRRGKDPFRREYEKFKRSPDGDSLRQYVRLRVQDAGTHHHVLPSTPESLVAKRQSLELLSAMVSNLPLLKNTADQLFGLTTDAVSGEVIAKRRGCHRSSVQRKKMSILRKLRDWLLEEESRADRDLGSLETYERPSRTKHHNRRHEVGRKRRSNRRKITRRINAKRNAVQQPTQ